MDLLSESTQTLVDADVLEGSPRAMKEALLTLEGPARRFGLMINEVRSRWFRISILLLAVGLYIFDTKRIFTFTLNSFNVLSADPDERNLAKVFLSCKY